MRERLPTYAILPGASEAPLVLYGPPHQLRGSVGVVNPGEERVTLRRACLSGDFLPHGPVTQRMSTLRVRPSEAAHFDLEFNLGPHTAPGRYSGEMEVAGVMHAVDVTVTEVHELNVSPETLVISGAPGSTVSKEIVVHNLGNVPVNIDPMIGLPLDDDLLDCRVLRATTSRLAERNGTSIDDVLKLLADAGQEVLQDAGILRARVTVGAGPLNPGEIRTLTCSFGLPKTLKFGSRYSTRFLIASNMVGLVVVPERLRSQESVSSGEEERGQDDFDSEPDPPTAAELKTERASKQPTTPTPRKPSTRRSSS